MAAFNKVIVVGNLGKDPEVKFMPNGDPVCEFSLAATEKWKTKDGEAKEHTEWINCKFFGALAEVIGKYAGKGIPLLVEGKLRTRMWEKDGVKHYRTEVIGERMQLLGFKKTDESGEAQENSADNAKPAARATPKQDDFDDDIPF